MPENIPGQSVIPPAPSAGASMVGVEAQAAIGRGLAAIVAGALCIAFSPLLVRLSELDPTATGFYRTFLALPLFVAWALVGERRVTAAPHSAERLAPTRSMWAAVVLAGIFFTGDLAAWHWSLRYTSVANSTFLANLTPVFVTVVAWRFFGERVSALFLLGLCVAVGGAAAMVGAGLSFDPARFLGDMLGVLTACFYAAYLVSVKGLRRRLSTPRLVGYTSAVTSVLLLVVSVAAGESLLPPTGRGLLVLLGLAWVSQVAGQGLIAYGLAHAPASFSSVSLLVQPVAAAILAWVLIGEAMTTWQMAGGVGVLAGIVIARSGVGGGTRAAGSRARV